MDCRRLSEKDMRDENLSHRKTSAYNAVVQPMSRAERRTAHGKMLIAMAEAASLRAEVEFLREEIKYAYS